MMLIANEKLQPDNLIIFRFNQNSFYGFVGSAFLSVCLFFSYAIYLIKNEQLKQEAINCDLQNKLDKLQALFDLQASQQKESIGYLWNSQNQVSSLQLAQMPSITVPNLIGALVATGIVIFVCYKISPCLNVFSWSWSGVVKLLGMKEVVGLKANLPKAQYTIYSRIDDASNKITHLAKKIGEPDSAYRGLDDVMFELSLRHLDGPLMRMYGTSSTITDITTSETAPSIVAEAAAVVTSAASHFIG